MKIPEWVKKPIVWLKAFGIASLSGAFSYAGSAAIQQLSSGRITDSSAIQSAAILGAVAAASAYLMNPPKEKVVSTQAAGTSIVPPPLSQAALNELIKKQVAEQTAGVK